MSAEPSVTIAITARNRPEELALTLETLRQQDYPNFNVCLIDDSSDVPLEPLVRRWFPQAQVHRNETPAGLVRNRSRMMAECRTDFLVSLDDDSCFTRPDELRRAVERMKGEPELGIVTFFVYQGAGPVPDLIPASGERYMASYFGCAHMMRSAMMRQVGGYRDFFDYYGEEQEYAMRVWDAGWRILYVPDVIVHHRVSDVGRRSDRILQHSVRNNLWSVILNYPAGRALLQIGWRLFSHGVEALRTPALGAYMRGVAQSLAGLPRVLKSRKAIRSDTLQLLDWLSACVVRPPWDTRTQLRVNRWSFLRMQLSAWRDRPRARGFWDKRPGDVGHSPTVTFRHNVEADERGGKHRP